MRTLLFVPADSQRKLEKAQGLSPDAIILDLEDGVGPDRKELARAQLTASLPAFRQSAYRILVRVNTLDSPWFAEDLHAACAAGVSGIVLSKTDRPTDVSDVAAVVDLLEEQKGLDAGTLRLFASIESASSLIQAEAIARSSPRLAGLLLGGEDYCADMGLVRTRSGEELQFARWTLSHAARAAGIRAIDAVFSAVGDDSGLFDDCITACRMGLQGKQVIHPGQIEIVNRAYAPDPAVLAWARRVVQAFDDAERKGESIVLVDGKMVDRPVMLQARRVLEAAGGA